MAVEAVLILRVLTVLRPCNSVWFLCGRLGHCAMPRAAEAHRQDLARLRRSRTQLLRHVLLLPILSRATLRLVLPVRLTVWFLNGPPGLHAQRLATVSPRALAPLLLPVRMEVPFVQFSRIRCPATGNVLQEQFQSTALSLCGPRGRHALCLAMV